MAHNPPARPNNEPLDFTLFFYKSTELAHLKHAAPRSAEVKLTQQ